MMQGANSSSLCSPCPAGTASMLVGASSVSSCLVCQIGTYAVAGSVECTPCSEGMYSANAGSSSCAACPAGSYSQKSASSCTKCAVGYFSSSQASVECTPCPFGTYSRRVGATSSLSCIPCDIGTYAPFSGSSFCLPCDAGTYSSYLGASICSLCPAGTYLPTAGASAQIDCQLCPAGTYLPTTGARGVEYCINCPNNTYSAIQGATSAFSCTACASGSYAYEGSAKCILCPAGTYSDATGNCIQCPAGTYSSRFGSSSRDNCVPCAAGTYSNSGFYRCFGCSAGYYSTGGATECNKCKPGTYNTISGSTTCSECLPGTFTSNEASQICNPCPQGTYQNVSGSSSCKPCLNSWYCHAGMVQPIDTSGSLASFESLNKTIVSSFDPYFTPGLTAESYNSSTGAATARLVIVLLTLMLILTLFIIVLIATILSRFTDKTLILYTIIAWFDRYTMYHHIGDGQTVVSKRTALGGSLTLTLYLIVTAILCLVFMDLYYDNVYDVTSIIPEAILPREFPKFVKSNYYMKLLLHNYNDNSCVPSFSVSGMEPFANLQTLTQKYANGTCVLNLVCNNCYLSGPSQTIDLFWYQLFAMATIIEYYIFIPHFLQGTKFVMYERVVPLENGYVFKGSQPTEFGLSLARAYYTTLAPDYFIGGIFSRASLTDRTSLGYIGNRFSTRLGSTVSPADFGSAQGFTIRFNIVADTNVFRIQTSAKANILGFLSRLFALVGGASAIIMVFMVIIEQVSTRCGRKKQKKLITPKSTFMRAEITPVALSLATTRNNSANNVTILEENPHLHTQYKEFSDLAARKVIEEEEEEGSRDIQTSEEKSDSRRPSFFIE